MSHLPLSLINRLNKTESAVFIFWMLYFQRILLSDDLITYVTSYLKATSTFCSLNPNVFLFVLLFAR